MQGELAYEVVDVFTGVPFAGNPLAVVFGADGLGTAQLQAVAREFHLSETAFPMAPTPQQCAQGVDYRLRIFTPETELPFAGHPSVGTAWVLAHRGDLAPGRVVQHCGAGPVVLDVACDGGPVELTGATPTLGPVMDDDVVLPAVGLGRGDLVGVPAQVAGSGLDFCYLFVRPGSIARAVPDLKHLRRLRTAGADIGGICVVGWHDGEARVRVFTHDIGAAEDPATGSAALALGVLLAAHGLVEADGETAYDVRQGVEVGRPSLMRCHVRAEGGAAVETRVAGEVVRAASGRIRVPPTA